MLQTRSGTDGERLETTTVEFRRVTLAVCVNGFWALLVGADGSNAPPNRLERLRRWKEKRKNRNFNKTIRYQSRKVCADNRPRIKGKFVKVGSTPDLGALAGGSLGGEEEEEEEDSFDSEGLPPPGSLARTAGLRRDGGLTAAMSVPDLTVLSSMGSGHSM